MSNPVSSDDIARQTLELVPFLMQVMSAEMRSTKHTMVGGHLRLLGQLSLTSYTLTELADVNMVSAPTMSNTITALETRGWLRRTRNNHDRRVVMIELTDEGRQIYSEIDSKTRQRVREILDPLDDADKTTVHQALGVLRQALANGVMLAGWNARKEASSE